MNVRLPLSLRTLTYLYSISRYWGKGCISRVELPPRGGALVVYASGLTEVTTREQRVELLLLHGDNLVEVPFQNTGRPEVRYTLPSGPRL